VLGRCAVGLLSGSSEDDSSPTDLEALAATTFEVTLVGVSAFVSASFSVLPASDWSEAFDVEDNSGTEREGSFFDCDLLLDGLGFFLLGLVELAVDPSDACRTPKNPDTRISSTKAPRISGLTSELNNGFRNSPVGFKM